MGKNTFIRKLRCSKRQADRLDIVAECKKKCMNFREIRDVVMKRLDLPSYSLQTVHSDWEKLQVMWNDDRLKNVDEYVNVELQKIDANITDLYKQWELSKKKIIRVKEKVDGVEVEKIQEVEIPANVTYMAEIRAQEVERRKLLGLYSAEKKQIQIEETSFTFDGTDPAVQEMAQKLFDSRKEDKQIYI